MKNIHRIIRTDKMKKKTGLKLCALFISAALALSAGVAVAYYNTKTIGFDSEAKIFSRDDDKISVLDFDIYYENIEKTMDSISSFLPENVITIAL